MMRHREQKSAEKRRERKD